MRANRQINLQINSHRDDRTSMLTEAAARIVVDRLLREAGWDIEDKSQVSTEEAAADGRADYLLKSGLTRPLAVVEAKRFSIDPYSAKGRAREYAQSLAAPFVILSNGREHYFWEFDTGDARPVVGLPNRADLERRARISAVLCRAILIPIRKMGFKPDILIGEGFCSIGQLSNTPAGALGSLFSPDIRPARRSAGRACGSH